jgi:LDH2 family malate/lactate/ureidoglycolate dehydrogenase
MVAIKVEAFRPITEFSDDLLQIAKAVKQVPPLSEGGEVMLPGEPEERARESRATRGIPVPDSLWCSLKNTAREYGVHM